MTTDDSRYGSDVIVEVLSALGIEYVAMNPGASFRGLHDSMVNSGSAPHLVTCLHEEIAVAVAHGYAKAARRPMSAMLHNVVGLQHSCMALFNAWCDRVPMLVVGRTGPVDADRRRPWIDWIHTALVQGTHIRDFTKWDDQPASLPAAVESLLRGYRLTRSAPAAPVYVCVPVEVQEATVDPPGPATPGPLSAYRPGRAGPDPAAIQEACDLIRSASLPVIVADRAADSEGAVAALASLAHKIAAPLIDKGSRMNVFTTDPYDATGSESKLLEGGDLIVAVEVQDLSPILASASREGRRPKVVNITLADSLVGSWAADYQPLIASDVLISADAALALSALDDAASSPSASVRGERLDLIAALRADRRRRWESESASRWNDRPISTARLASEVWTALQGREWVLAHGTLRGWARRTWVWEREGAYLGIAGGGGIGYGPGAAIGAALAYRGSGRIIVNLQPDGDLLYTPSALWTMVNEQLPILNVVWNNRAYYNSEEHANRMAKLRARPTENTVIGTRINSPHVDFATLARSYGFETTLKVEDPADLHAVLTRAVAATAAGEPALVDVISANR